jgi:hypothetical protein
VLGGVGYPGEVPARVDGEEVSWVVVRYGKAAYIKALVGPAPKKSVQSFKIERAPTWAQRVGVVIGCGVPIRLQARR